MKVNFSLVLDDDALRRVRAAQGRGGKATRSDVRMWLQRLADAGLRHAPEPKVRRKASPAAQEAAGATKSPVAEAQDVSTDETLCGRCGWTRGQHHALARHCPPPKAGGRCVSAGRFAPVTS